MCPGLFWTNNSGQFRHFTFTVGVDSGFEFSLCLAASILRILSRIGHLPRQRWEHSPQYSHLDVSRSRPRKQLRQMANYPFLDIRIFDAFSTSFF